jgi:hypothetical protein
VWPGEAIKTDGVRVDATTVAVQAYAGGRPEPVISNAWAKIAS